ncbi:hypothetical protein [Bacillus sp. S10(2024)]|uniref:hypothetical protein n=1 Tax=Bacillus sp. S10(2024) TaxID=3162886 RepID=UPI003D1EB273
MYQFLSLDELFSFLPNEGSCVIEAGSIKELASDKIPVICYFVNVTIANESRIFTIHEMGDMGIGGEIANQKRLPHMQFAIQAAEFLYKSIHLYALMNEKNIQISLKFRMGMPVTGMVFHERWDMFFAEANKGYTFEK